MQPKVAYISQEIIHMIEANEITKFYGKGESRFQVLKNISLKINDGDFTVILGASGSGKSTLLNTLSSLERPDSGSIFYDERDITALSERELTKLRRDSIGFIFQQYYLLPNMNVDKNVRMGADLSGNKNYSKGSRWRGRLLKIQRCCFWTNPRAHLTRKQADKSLTTYALCKTSMALLSLW